METAADLRAMVARRQIPLYQLAARVNLNPQRLGQMLRERIPLSPEVAARLHEALAGDRGEAPGQ